MIKAKKAGTATITVKSGSKTVKEQLENAKQEVVKPFPKEKELNQMMERLSELNALLNMDEQGSSEEPENSGKQSIHDKLNAIKQNGQQEHDHDKSACK